jgi:hypothetical protein
MTVPLDDHNELNSITMHFRILIGLVMLFVPALAWSIATRVQNREVPLARSSALSMKQLEEVQRRAMQLQAEAKRSISSGTTDCGIATFQSTDADHSVENKRYSRVPVDACVVAAFRKRKSFRAEYQYYGLTSGDEQTLIGTKEGHVYFLHRHLGEFPGASARLEKHPIIVNEGQGQRIAGSGFGHYQLTTTRVLAPATVVRGLTAAT